MSEFITPLITISIASYNRLSFLKKSVESCLSQSHFQDYEILIVDDGSDHNTRTWLDELQSGCERVRVHFKENSGVGETRKLGVEFARGQYVLILDSDDLLVGSALSTLSTYIQQNPDIDLFYCNNLEIHPGGEKRNSQYPMYPDNELFKRAIFSRPRVPFKHSGTAYRKKVAINCGNYDPNLRIKIDIDFILKILSNPEVSFMLIKEPLVNFYFHKDSISRGKRILGIKVWLKLIEKYSNQNRVIKVKMTVQRVVSEFAKMMYEIFFLRS